MPRCEVGHCRGAAAGLLVLHADLDGFRADFFCGAAIRVCMACQLTVTHPHGGRMTFVSREWACHVSNGPARKAFNCTLRAGGGVNHGKPTV
jgi:hypothetical protein